MSSRFQNVVKEYPQRGPMKQYRLESSTAFHCFRCNSDKKSKLITIYSDNWDKVLCNGCYGYLLSIYDIKAGTDEEDIKANKLAALLLSCLPKNKHQIEIDKLKIVQKKKELLSSQSLVFLATSDYVARKLDDKSSNLDWSPAIIGLCKTFELEIVNRLIEPLKSALINIGLENDLKDKDFGRIAKYCAGKLDNPPELGAIGHFLNTAANSKARIQKSDVLKKFNEILSEWPRASWLFSKDGAAKSIKYLTSKFRNKAAHTIELSKEDYDACWEFVVSDKGILWSLISSTLTKKDLKIALK